MAAKTSRKDVRLNQKFGELLKERREKKGLKQVELAVTAGVARTTIVKIERGEDGVRLALLYRLADALELHPRDLLPDVAAVRPVASEAMIKQSVDGPTAAILLDELQKPRKSS